MNRTNIDIALNIYDLCFQPVLAAIAGIAPEDFIWKPAPESRSISEICRHLVRVEGWFLVEIGIEPHTGDPGCDETHEVEQALKSSHEQVAALVRGLEDDAALRKKMKARSSDRTYSFDYIVKHISQHYLYHASQIIYLRRAQDRDWQPPLKQWETAVDTISEHTWKA